jgi:hypothetical protein
MLRRTVLLVLSLAAGCAVGCVGSLLSGSHWWFLAVPGAVAGAWLIVANPERCLSHERQSKGSGGSAA